MRMAFRKIPEKYRDLFDKIRGDRRHLAHFCYVYRGIWTGVLRVFVIDDEILREFDIEKDAIRPILRGKDIFPFFYRFSNRWVIYTNQENFFEKFPNAIKYLEKHKIILERRGAVWIHGKNWWELEEPLSPDMFEVEKIISPYTSNRNSFALDLSNYYVMDSTIVIRFWRDDNERSAYFTNFGNLHSQDLESFIKESQKALEDLPPTIDNLKYILGVLNSDLIEFYIKLYSPMVSKRIKKPPKGRYFLYIPPYPNIIPIEVAEKETRIKIANLTDELSKISKAIDKLRNEEIVDEEKIMELENQRNRLFTNLNELIFDIYEINESERAVIQSYVLKKR